jgi:hypothetical protein
VISRLQVLIQMIGQVFVADVAVGVRVVTGCRVEGVGCVFEDPAVGQVAFGIGVQPEEVYAAKGFVAGLAIEDVGFSKSYFLLSKKKINIGKYLLKIGQAKLSLVKTNFESS